MKYVYLTICITLALSCQNINSKTRSHFKDFPKTEHISYQTIKTPPVLFIVTNMLLCNDILITYDRKADYFFQVFKLPDFNYIGEFVKKGNGPNREIIISKYIQKLKGNQFYYNTMSSIKTLEFNLEDKAFEIKRKTRLPGELMNIQHIFQLKEDIFHGINLSPNSTTEYITFNTISGEIKKFGSSFPKVNRKVTPSQNNLLFGRILNCKPDQSLFASVYTNFPILRIHNDNGDLLSEVWFDNKQKFPEVYFLNIDPSNPNREKIREYQDQKMLNYIGIKSTNTYIYALYVGKTRGHLRQENNLSNTESNEIHVWDWKGNPIKRIILNKAISCFDVAKDNSYIISSSVNSLETLFKFNLDEK